MRRADLEQLEIMAGTSPSRIRFLTELTLDPPDALGREAGPPARDEDWLVLSTIHSAKGREWRAVSVLDCVDGCIPSDMATGTKEEVEEERRLLYVAMTRARDELHLVQPERFHVTGQSRRGDRHVRVSRTRFVTTAMLGLFEVVGHPGHAGSPDAALRHPMPAVDIAADLRLLATGSLAHCGCFPVRPRSRREACPPASTASSM
jgi:DNA helicase-2/ATP-dependent DNA helicase PcrA